MIKGKTYETTTEFALPRGIPFAYPDDENLPKLTDGKISSWDFQAAVGWIKQGKISIAFDLPKPGPVSFVKCHALGGGAAGVFFPSEIRIYGGENKDKMEFIGNTVDRPKEPGRSRKDAWMVADIISEKSFKYIKIEIYPLYSHLHTMIDEIEIVYYEDETLGEKKVASERQEIYSFYPSRIIPASDFQLGFVYFGSTPQWPPAVHMRKMREFGFNIVHSECNTGHGRTGWADLSPEKGRYEWIALDRFVTEAADAGLNVPLMIGIEGRIPCWVLEESPEAAFINPYGEKVPGLVDFGNRQVLENLNEYLSKMAERYKNCSNVIGYIIGDEYSVYQNYYHKENFYGQNFNPRMQKAFQDYLKDKFKTIDNFNVKTATKHENFNDVCPELEWLTRDKYAGEWLEWCLFREAESARIYRAMYDTIKKVSPEKKIIFSSICHSWPYNTVSGVSLDQCSWADVYAKKIYTKDTPAGILSLPVNARMHTRTGKEFWFSNLNYLSEPNSEDCHVRGIFESLGAGVKTAIYFLWDIAGGKKRWGSSVVYGPTFLYQDEDKNCHFSSETETLKNLTPFLGRYGNILAKAESLPSQIGIVIPYTTYHNEVRESVTEKLLESRRYPSHPPLGNSYRSMMESGKFFLKNNYAFEGFSEPADDTKLKNYKTCSLIGNQYLSQEVMDRFRRYLKDGGTLIVDSTTGIYDEAGKKRENPIIDIFSDYRDRIFIFDNKKINADASEIKDFLEHHLVRPPVTVEPSGSEVGAYAMQINDKDASGTVVILINRGEYGSEHKNLRVCINRNALPDGSLEILEVNPYPGMVGNNIQFEKNESGIVVPVKSLVFASVLFISETGKSLSVKTSDKFTPMYEKAEWFYKECPFRMPVRVYGDTGNESYINLDMNDKMKESGVEIFPSLDSFRMTKCDSSGRQSPMPIKIFKNRYFNQFENYVMKVNFIDSERSNAVPETQLYYLYFGAESLKPSSDCQILESQWCFSQEKGNLVFRLDSNDGRKASVVDMPDGIIVNDLSIEKNGAYNLFVLGKCRNIPFRMYDISRGNRVLKRGFCNYDRTVFIDAIPLKTGKNRLELRFSDYKSLDLSMLLLLPVEKDFRHDYVDTEKNSVVEIGHIEKLHGN